MPDIFPILDLLPSVSELLDGLINVQHGAGWDDPLGDPYMYPEPEPSIGLGTLLAAMFIGLALQCLLGWWGKSRAEDFGVNPWIGFALGFCLGFIGIGLVPVFRKDRILVTRNPRTVQHPMQPNPMYAPGTQAYSQPQPGYPPPQGYGRPMPGYAPTPQPAPPVPQQEMLVADEYGYVECPHCQTRTKAGRKACMNCGNFLPPIYDPNIR